MVWNRWKDWDKTWMSTPEYLDYREQVSSFDELGIWTATGRNLTGDQEPERVRVAAVTASTFQVLGADAAVGRIFSQEEDFPGKDEVVVLSYALWQRRYGGNPAVVGTHLYLDGERRTILGIMSAGFTLPLEYKADELTELWIPFALDPATVDRTERGNHSYYAVARLAPGATADQANSELEALTTRFTNDGLYPAEMQFETFVLPVKEEIFGSIRPALILLLGAVGFLLLIACANVANLHLTRTEARRREIAIRTAIGAVRRRLLSQFLTESLVLSLLGGAVGVGLALAGSRVLVAWNPANIPRVSEVTIDMTVLLFALGVSLLTAILFGLAPALHASKLELTQSLKEGSQATTIGSSRRWFRSGVVVAELALAVVLMIGAGLMLKSFWQLMRIDTGFRSENVLTLRLSLPEASYPEPEDIVPFYEQLLERVRALPGVEHAGLARNLPLAEIIGDWGLRIEGRDPTPENRPKGDWQVASSGYFEALGMKLAKGRFLTHEDRTDSLQVAVINETMAEKYWPGEDPIGRRFRMGSREDRPWVTIVGMVGDVAHNGINVKIKEKFYRPHAQFHRSSGWAPSQMSLVVKTTSHPTALIAPIRSQVKAMDPNLPIAEIRTMDQVLAGSVSEPRFTTMLLGLFAAVAMMLAAVGIYGVISYSVGQRRHEIGIRMAMGAERSQVLKWILGQGLALSLAGLALGLLLAFGVTGLMAGLLYQVTPTDWTTFGFVPAALLLVALAASYIPARRATRMDPVTALRNE
jgi:putative ABC transport system permease protein